MSETPFEAFEAIIGLEIHVQLNTKTKLFSSAPNHFGDEPNQNIGVVDTAQPGSLPVLNQEAVKKAILFGLAVNSQISKFSHFDRKSYFYPDSPRNYQITQFNHPLLIGGEVKADVEGKSQTFFIESAHIEDDAGMLKHFNSFAGIDFNRAGVPLLEIVSKPCMHSPKEASAYAQAIRAIMMYINASDCNMDEGSLRMDVNISVRPKGESGLRNKIEIKNMNSFRNMELAIESEIRRQTRLYLAHPHQDPKTVIKQSTVRFDLETLETVLMRSKEGAADYRYFPEPDLPPLILTDEEIFDLKQKLPELPHERFERYITTLDLSEYNAALLVNDKALSDYYEKSLKKCKNAKTLCNWITVEFVGRLKEKGISLFESKIPSSSIAELVNLIEEKTITGKIAKKIADDLVLSPEKTPLEIIEENPDYKPIDDHKEIESLIDSVLSENEQSILDYKAGITKAFNYLVGQIMKRCKGKAAPHIVQEILKEKLDRD
ncbi:MAG: Asp-tRNA(Asn)/Glu-tRNA(Gln) amidotransferase subunit GatB [Simkaniaceae bacterium]